MQTQDQNQQQNQVTGGVVEPKPEPAENHRKRPKIAQKNP